MPTLDSLFYKPGHQVLAVLVAAGFIVALTFGGIILFHSSARGTGVGVVANPVVAAPPRGLIEAETVTQRLAILDHGITSLTTPKILTKALAAVPGARLIKDEAIDGYGLVRIAVPVAGESVTYCIEFRGPAYPSAMVCPAN